MVREVYDKHRGQFTIDAWPHGDAATLDDNQRETIDAVLHYYGDKSSQWLVELTHRERPWKDARGDLAHDARCDTVITHAAMAEYYASLLG